MTPNDQMKKILGPKAQQILNTVEEISPDFAKYISDFAYGDLHSRNPGLSDKLREITIVACLIGKGNAGLPLRTHLQGMLNVGWSREEVVELIILMIVYVGFPDALQALLASKEVFDEIDEKKSLHIAS